MQVVGETLLAPPPPVHALVKLEGKYLKEMFLAVPLFLFFPLFLSFSLTFISPLLWNAWERRRRPEVFASCDCLVVDFSFSRK